MRLATQVMRLAIRAPRTGGRFSRVGRRRYAAAACAIAAIVTTLASSAPARAESAHYCAKSGELRFRAADGTRLAGHRFGRGKTAVVFAHELRGSACQWVPYARRLARKGYLTITFDFRGYGDSQTRTGAAALRQAADVTAAAKLARSLGATRVFLVGASMGGTAVIVAALNARPAVDGVVALSAVTSFGRMDALAAVRKLAMPQLYIVGRLDQGFFEESKTLFEASATQDKRLEIRDNGFHGVQFTDDQGSLQLIEQFVASR